jgi:uroporphyrinogen decarboxylase
MLYRAPEAFDALIGRITEATAAYLIAQIEAGAEVVKIFDSWAGGLPGPLFRRYAIEPVRAIVEAVRAAAPGVPIIGFPRGAGGNYAAFVAETGVEGCALDTGVDPAWAVAEMGGRTCLQGNLDPMLMVLGGAALDEGVRAVVEGFRPGPHIFNLGHGITPEADPENVHRMLAAIRG